MTSTHPTRRYPSRLLMRLALWAQRFHGVVPSTTMSRRLSHLLARTASVAEASQPLDDWTRPLIERAGSDEASGTSRGLLPVAEHPVVPVDEAGWTPDHAAEHAADLSPSPRRLTCLVATDTLGVGGVQEVVAMLARRLPSYGIDTLVTCSRSSVSASTSAGGWVARQLLDEDVRVLELSSVAFAELLAHEPPQG